MVDYFIFIKRGAVLIVGTAPCSFNRLRKYFVIVPIYYPIRKIYTFLENVDISTVTQLISSDFRFVSSLFAESGFAEATAI